MNTISFSVVLCTYNREKHIKQCIYSLVNQRFPKDQYEIIVVDDGSSDRTTKIVEKFPVRLIEHKNNQGVAAARNTGLAAAKGRIFVCFDDDCIADKEWLRNLAAVYKKNKTQELTGVAGFITLPNKANGIIDNYMHETGYANPSPPSYTGASTLLDRFIAYLKNMFFPNIQTQQETFKVGEIWGANCSFPIKILKSINGWNTLLSGVEDTDLCDRIKKKYPEGLYLCTKKAILIHDHQLSLKSFLQKPYKRGSVILKFYQQNGKIPPFFPFPIILGLALLFALIIHPILFIPFLIGLPQLLYMWWGILAIKRKQRYYLLFPYLQSGYEFALIVGLIRGYIKKG